MTIPTEPIGSIPRQSEWLRVTLASIGDAVITTDTKGQVLSLNQVAESLTGWKQEDASGRPLDQIFRIVNDETGEPGENPVEQALREGRAVGLASHSVLIARDGTQTPVDDSAAPIRDEQGQVHGVVLIFRSIADRRKVEEAQARLAAIVESSQDAIISKTLEGRIVSWNAGAEQMFGYTASEAIGQSITILIPPERLDEERMILERIRRGERVEHYETVRVTKDRRCMYVSLTISPVRDGSGRIIGASKISRDISARKRSEQRLATQNSVTQALAESASLKEAAPRVLKAVCEAQEWQVGAMWYLDKAKKLLRCADMYHLPSVAVPQFEAFCREGRTFARGVGLPGRIWLSGQAAWIRDVLVDPNFPRAAIARAEGLHAAFGFPIILNGDVLGVMEFFSHDIREPDTQLLGMMTTIGSQVGQFIERRRAEEALWAAEKRTEETARFLADASGELAELTDSKSTLQKVAALAVPFFADWCVVDIQDADGTLQRLASTHKDPGKIERALELSRLYPPDLSAAHGPHNVLRTGQTEWMATIPDSLLEQSARDAEHLRLLRELGLKSYISTPLRSRSKPIGVITFITAESDRSYDAADVAAAEDLARRAAIAVDNANLLATLKETDRRKDEFLAMLAHELRNPLAPIRNAVQIFRGKGLPVPELRWATDVIDRQVRQLSRLVDDLLDVSRITRGRVELRKERIDLTLVVQSAIEASRPVIEKWEHELTVTLPPHPVRLDADPTRLAQVFLNLLNNAAKYTDRGGHIELTAQEDGDRIVIRVKDNGIGIPPEMLPRVFDLFSQVDRSLERSEGGLGIGLTLVERLVALHGGTVQAHSEGPGKGSEFVVRLPIISEPARRKTGPQPEPEVVPTARRILIVDDNRDAADSLGVLLRMMGNEVHTAHDGLEAVGSVAAFRPDVVLLDIGLPKLSGYEAARRIREQEEGDKILLVALTGWGQEEDRRRSREAGFDHHMNKPVDFDALKQLLAGTGSRRGRGRRRVR